MKNNIIYHNTTTKFNFWERVRILFGAAIHVHSEIETNYENVNVTGRAQCTADVDRLIPPRI